VLQQGSDPAFPGRSREHGANDLTADAGVDDPHNSTLPAEQPDPGETQAGDRLDLLRQRAGALRTPPPSKIGAIDVGSNSIHLVMAEIMPDGDFRTLGRDKAMIHLGRGGFRQHVLTQRAMDDGIAALTRFLKMARLKGIRDIRAVASSAVREATNGGDFVQRVRREAGLELHIISPLEEARLIYLAVRHTVDLGGQDRLIFDVGGGSLELIVGNAHRPRALASAKLGVSRLAELLLHDDPPTDAQLKDLRRHIDAALEPIYRQVGQPTPPPPAKEGPAGARALATSGTFQQLAALCARRRADREIDTAAPLSVTRSELKALYSELIVLSRVQRLKLPGLDAQRVDMVIPGAAVVLSVMRRFGVEEVSACDMALREGIILDVIRRERAHLRARAALPDPRARTVIQLARRCGFARPHAEQVARLAGALFDSLRRIHGLPDDLRELLHYACLLHDVGYHISYRGHHKHSYYLVRNGGLHGFTEQEIEIIANLARYHRKERPKKSHYSFQRLTRESRRIVRRLIPLVRLANALDRTHYSVVQSVACRVTPRRVQVLVRTDRDAELELWTARHQAALFEREYGLPLEISVESPPAIDDRSTARE